MSDLGPVIITAREVYDAVTRVSMQVTELTSKIEAVAKAQEDGEEVRRDHENRIRALEKGRWPVVSVSILLTIVAIVVTVYFNLNK